MDAQGPDRPRPYVEQAGATFTTLVDEANLLGGLFGFKVVPNGFLIDEDGVLRYKRLGGFDVRRNETREVLDEWVAGSDLTHLIDGSDDESKAARTDSNELFAQGQALYRKGKIEQALELWRQGVALDPGNYIVRKQIWAVENPDRFYSGDIDYAWQREQT
jgi:hypothetical protein